MNASILPSALAAVSGVTGYTRSPLSPAWPIPSPASTRGNTSSPHFQPTYAARIATSNTTVLVTNLLSDLPICSAILLSQPVKRIRVAHGRRRGARPRIPRSENRPMDIRVAGSIGTQVTPHKVNRRDRECQIRSGHCLAAHGTTPSGATSVGSSYRQVGPKDPAFVVQTLAGKCPVQARPEAGKRPAPHPHPVDAGRAATRKGARPGQFDIERSHLVERLRRGDEPRQKPRRHVAHETQGDVQAVRWHPAYGRQGLAHGGERVPERLPNRGRWPDREEQALGPQGFQVLQATGTATGRRTASTP